MASATVRPPPLPPPTKVGLGTCMVSAPLRVSVAGLKTNRTIATLLLDESATNTKRAPAGRPVMLAPAVATIACPAAFAAFWQLDVVHGGVAPGAESTRQIPST